MANTSKKLHITEGLVVINATFNNTTVTLTDLAGNTVAQKTSGALGYRGARKSTPHASKEAADFVAKAGKEKGLKVILLVKVKGPGSGRESALRAFPENGIEIKAIRDITPLPHNGCRPRKKRRI